MDLKITKKDELEKGKIEIYCHSSDYECVKELLYQSFKHSVKIMAYDDEHNMYMIPLVMVYYIENIDNKSFIYTKEHTYRSYQAFSVLKKIYQILEFRQINKNTIVNINHISSIRIISECRRLLQLDNNEQLIVNRKFHNFMK